jgi:hypothetical protein
LKGLANRADVVYESLPDALEKLGLFDVTSAARYRLARWVRRLETAAAGLADELSLALAEVDELEGGP